MINKYINYSLENLIKERSELSRLKNLSAFNNKILLNKYSINLCFVEAELIKRGVYENNNA